ncbi:Tfp pilus assembly protein PilX [Noviherbaspirillum humi]|uniref:Tfp pilus assembly protein PilX n=1 Tax=Noviherbaspirillum humi TaxID=1688639 RepID=A0A239LIR6_9BURK|nr:hypothetical protein [Noviherbaspirillum humi]SNT29812.1 Tfp pilus assembly protein PilX [Noviherbaspirillum humi]
MKNARKLVFRAHASARGIVLIIVLVVLLAMAIASVALVRSVYTTNIVAGNIAFHQSALHASQLGVEAAYAWLRNQPALQLNMSIESTSATPVAYVAFREDPAEGQSWEDFWNQVLVPAKQVNTLPNDDTGGNTVAYVIHRLCQTAGASTAGANCDARPSVNPAGTGSKGAGVIAINAVSPIYYRVTVRVSGPRNTVRFVQSIVSL